MIKEIFAKIPLVREYRTRKHILKTLAPTVEANLGKSYTNLKGNVYFIDEQGRFHGRESIEGARIAGVLGLSSAEHSQPLGVLSKNYDTALGFMGSLHRTVGDKQVQEGDYLVVLLTRADAERFNRSGFVSSLLKNISKGDKK